MPRISPRLRLRNPRKGRSGFAPRARTIKRLSDLEGVRDDPGSLHGRCYVPAGLKAPAPLPLDGADALGAAGAHMLDVGLSSTARIAAFFGIAPEAAAEKARAEAKPAQPSPRTRTETRPEPAGGPQAVIEKALRAAGLVRCPQRNVGDGTCPDIPRRRGASASALRFAPIPSGP